jgi:hypothetical protein
VEPAGAEPTIFGEFWLAGEAGVVEVSDGVPTTAVLIVKLRVAGLPSALPAASAAFTRKVWDPSASPE